MSQELKRAAEKMRNDGSKYTVHESLEPGHGEGNYKLEFYAKKKGGFGLLSTVANIAKGAMYGGIEGAFRRAVYEVSSRKFRATFEPIDQEMTGSEIAVLMKRWSETIPKGYIETIGSTLLLPDDPSYISAKIKPGKEIRILIDFARLKEIREAEEAVKKVAEAGEKIPAVPVPATIPVPVPVIPPNMAAMLPTVITQIYLRGSLKNTDEGYHFMLHNGLTPVAIVAPIELIVDGQSVDLNKIIIAVGGEERKSNEISSNKPLAFNVGDQLTIKVIGDKLSPGTHSINIRTSLQGYGPISFVISDRVA